MGVHTDSSSCACGGSCGCQSSAVDQIAMTREEYVQRLKSYLVELRAEIEAVEKELTALHETA